MTVRDIPCGFWFELVRNGHVYYKLCAGKKKYHSVCVKHGEKTAMNMSNQSYARLIKQMSKPTIRAKSND